MKRPLTLLTCLYLPIASCGRNEGESEIKPLGDEASLDRKVISLSFLQGNQAAYVDHEVAVATYLFTHEEGPWIGDNLKKPLVDTMSLKVTEQSRLVAKDSAKFRWWYEYQEGCPVVLSGIFRVGRWKIGHERFIENHPYIEVSQATEVGADDPSWKSHATKGEAAPSDGEEPPN